MQAPSELGKLVSAGLLDSDELKVMTRHAFHWGSALCGRAICTHWQHCACDLIDEVAAMAANSNVVVK